MKKEHVKRLLSVMTATAMVVSMLSGCGSTDGSSNESSSESEKGGDSQTADTASDEDIEVWGTNTGYLPVEAGSDLYNLYKEIIGVGIVQPYVEWNGGETYLEQLNLRIAAGDMPDVFSPYNGIESELNKKETL